MKFDHPALFRCGGIAISALMKAWFNALDYRAAYYDPRTDPIHPDAPARCVYVVWHEYLVLPLAMRHGVSASMLVSRHRDARWLVETARVFGFGTVEGSSKRGGVAAVKSILDSLATRHLVITPDGPRGPRREFQTGAVYLASRLGFPLVCLGFGCDRPWRLNSWDRFALPRPGSRVRGIVGPAMHIPPDADRDELERHRLRTQRMLNTLSDAAAEWAEAGDSMENEAACRADRFPQDGHGRTLKLPVHPTALTEPGFLGARTEAA